MSAPLIRLAMPQTAVETFFTDDALARLAMLGAVVADDDPGAARAPIWVTSWSTRLPAHLDARLLVHTGGSVRRLVAVERLSAGLRVSQPGAEAMAPAVAELSVTLTLMLLRRVQVFDRRLQSTHDWTHARTPALSGSLADSVVGIVGLSRVGRRYARMIGALGARSMLAYDPYATEETARELGVDLVGLDELCERSDVLAVHAPVTEETNGLIGARRLGLLRDGAIVVNTARSRVTDETALVEELVSGRLSAGLDVFDEEPLDAQSPLFGRENVVLTPHVAGATQGARHMQGDLVVDEISRHVAGEALRHEVTVESYARLA